MTTTDRRDRPFATRLKVLTALLAALALVGCDVSFSTSGGQGAGLLDTERLEREIASGLAEQLGGSFEVVCPGGQPMTAGTSFTCEATDEAGQVGVIAVEALDDTGNVDWEVVEVRPAPDGDAAPAPADEDPPAEPEPAAEPDVRPAGVPADWVRFGTDATGFSLWHPADWSSEGGDGTYLFRGPPGTELERAVINVQLVLRETPERVLADEAAFSADLQQQILDAGGEIIEEQTEVLDWASGSQQVEAFTSIYELGGEQFAQITIVGARDERSLVQLAYTAPIDVFVEDHDEIIVTMLESYGHAPMG